jgi:hypothetical protein
MSTTKGRAQLSPGGGGGRTASSSCGLVRVVAPPPQEMVKREREDLARVREGSAFETPALILNADGGTNIWVFFSLSFLVRVLLLSSTNQRRRVQEPGCQSSEQYA